MGMFAVLPRGTLPASLAGLISLIGLSGGFLGLPGGSGSAVMQVVDVYRREGDKLAENWILIDIPYWLKQQGLDVLDRTQKILNSDR